MHVEVTVKEPSGRGEASSGSRTWSPVPGPRRPRRAGCSRDRRRTRPREDGDTDPHTCRSRGGHHVPGIAQAIVSTTLLEPRPAAASKAASAWSRGNSSLITCSASGVVASSSTARSISSTKRKVPR